MYQQYTCIKPEIPWSVTARCWQTAMYWSSGFSSTDFATIQSLHHQMHWFCICRLQRQIIKQWTVVWWQFMFSEKQYPLQWRISAECKFNHNIHLRVYFHPTENKRIRWKDYPRGRKRIQRELTGKPYRVDTRIIHGKWNSRKLSRHYDIWSRLRRNRKWTVKIRQRRLCRRKNGSGK